jgi:imidazolonepropionase-like amidohydrolase
MKPFAPSLFRIAPAILVAGLAVPLGIAPQLLLSQATTPAPVAARAITVDRGVQQPAVSPDGRRIAVSVLGRIFVVPIEGGVAEPITHGVGWHTSPAWSPDGGFLAYAHHLPGRTHLALQDLAAGTTRFVHATELGISAVAFDPSGRELYFVHDRNQYDAHIWRVPLAGGGAEALTETENWHEWSFALAPDGERMLFESGRYGGADVYVMRLADRSVERITRSPHKEHAVAWLPDGRWAWLRQDNGVDHLIVREPVSGEERVVWSAPYDEKTLALTPDGGAAIVASARRLVRVDLATGRASPIPFTASFTARPPPPGDLVITNARVFTGAGDAYVPNATIVVRAGRIASVQSATAGDGGDARAVVAVSTAGVPVLDARGRVVMAGLMDNHRHYWSPFAGDRLLASGITAIRDPGVSIATSMSFKDANALGLLPGPDIFTTGPLIDGPGGYHPKVDVALDRPDAAAPLVRALHAQGVDALKAYFLLEPEIVAAVVREAKALGLPVTGHLGVRTSWSEALDAGIDGFSHIRVWKDFLPRELQPQGDDESLDGTKWPLARLQLDWRLIDVEGDDVAALLRRMAAAGVALDATLAVHQVGAAARRRYGPEEFEIARAGYRAMQRFVARAHEHGVTLLAGTDNRSIFDELEAYAEAGVPNAAILRAATVNGAAWLGRADDFGTVEPGRRANLIIVDGDPLADIAELRRIRKVVKEGRVVVRQ